MLAQPWERAYAISNIGDSVTIITTQNREINGKIQQIGSPSEDNDLLLENPEEVIRDESGNVTEVRPAGDFSYHHYRDIARVEFSPKEEFDPEGDTEGVRSFRGQVSTWMNALKQVPPINSISPEEEQEKSVDNPESLSIKNDSSKSEESES